MVLLEIAKMVMMLRVFLRKGRAMGNDKFISKLEKLLSRRLRTLPVGRPRRFLIKCITWQVKDSRAYTVGIWSQTVGGC
jgi:hypothetical protein